MKFLKRYDYIIVGAGSAGCVLANKLSADKSRSVLLIEAGPMDRDPMIHVPAGVYYAYRNRKINWNYRSEAESCLFNRKIDTPRGKVVGGSSSINSMVYMRGHPFDYDRWSSELGLPLWSYAHCLPYFKNEETSDRGENTWRGDNGPLGVTKGQFDNPLYDAFLEAGQQAGQGESEDLNGYKPEGVSRLDSTKRNGRRCSAAAAYLHPILKYDNLTLVTRAIVQKILFDGTRAIGVKFNYQGEATVVEAEQEIILSGGAINSPQLLMVSGVGPADHLREHGIKPVVNLTGVGQNLQDHATVIMQWACLKPVSIHKEANLMRQIISGFRWLVDRSGVAASNIWEAGGLIRGNSKIDYPNLQYHFGPVGISEVGGDLNLNQAFSIHIDQLRPRSRGFLALKSAGPNVSPALYFNYLSDEHDLIELVEGVHKARDLVSQSAFNQYRGEELVPGPQARSDNDIRMMIRNLSGTDYHPCGTCRMGTGPDAVVDFALRVHDIQGLRVADASIIPNIISANLNAPVQMIASRAADFILNRPQLSPLYASFHFNE